MVVLDWNISEFDVGILLSVSIQVARAILENPNDATKLHLIYANVTYEDILLKVHIYLFFVIQLVHTVHLNVWTNFVHALEWSPVTEL